MNASPSPAPTPRNSGQWTSTTPASPVPMEGAEADEGEEGAEGGGRRGGEAEHELAHLVQPRLLLEHELVACLIALVACLIALLHRLRTPPLPSCVLPPLTRRAFASLVRAQSPPSGPSSLA